MTKPFLILCVKVSYWKVVVLSASRGYYRSNNRDSKEDSILSLFFDLVLERQLRRDAAYIGRE